MAMSLQLAAAIAGVAGPIIFISVLTVAGLMRDGYDPVTRFVSDLAIGEAGWLQTANFIAFGALLIVFAAGLRRGLADGPAVRVSVVLLSLSGLGLVLAGLFPTDLAGQPSTAHGEVHFAASLLTFGTLLAAFFLIARVFDKDVQWARYARYSTRMGIIVGALCLAATAATPAATFNNFHAGPLAPWTGLVQRALFLVAFGWIAVIGFRLLRLRSLESP
ncbi:MAG: DUF998 domain-containing protein [Chloroflexi bacterium]|nr:MAG: DUF998 domain-containing protein [Chloroflexota bacterium]